jgi:hypothetical protein
MHFLKRPSLNSATKVDVHASEMGTTRDSGSWNLLSKMYCIFKTGLHENNRSGKTPLKRRRRGWDVKIKWILNMMRWCTVQWEEALLYIPEGRGFDSQWCRWNFSLALSFRSHSGPGFDSASNRNEYQEYFLGGKGGRCVMLTNLLTSCADCLEIWEPQPPGTLRVCAGLNREMNRLVSQKTEYLSQLIWKILLLGVSHVFAHDSWVWSVTKPKHFLLRIHL